MSIHEREGARQRLPGDRFLERLDLFWALVFYLSLGVSLAAAIGGLRGWPLAAALSLSAASAGLFQGLFWPSARRLESWPMPNRRAAIYFGGQVLILAALQALSPSFAGLGFAVMGQILGRLRPRHWPMALVPLVALLAGPLGWIEIGEEPDWIGIASLGLLILIGLFIATLLSLLFHQRHRLLELVRDLRRARAELEGAAAEREELAVLRERTRLARAMHDSLGHALVSVNVKLEAAQRLYAVDAARGAAELEATRALVRETMAELRRSIADLRAPVPDRRDLPAALRRLAEEVSARGGLAVAVEAGSGDAPAPAVAEALYMIAREALVNVERHAGAARAAVRVARDGAGWRLEVEDDGGGVRPADLRRPGHFGVVGMRERAGALGGDVRVSAGPGGGTRVAATIPDPATVSP